MNEQLRRIIKEEVYKVMTELWKEDPIDLSKDMISADEKAIEELEDELKYREADARVANLPKDERDARTSMVKAVKDKLDAAKKSLDMANQSEDNAVKFSEMQTQQDEKSQTSSQTSSQI